MRSFCILLFFLLAAGCSSTPEPIPDNGFDYFPLRVGAYQIYSVDETVINQSIEQKSAYELKLEIVDSLLNQEGGYSYIIQRQKRGNASLPWENLDNWTARIANREAIMTEGNTSFVKITFPAQNGLAWDGNAFNTLGGDQYCGESKDRSCDIYQLREVGGEFTAGDNTFAETLSVIQNESEDLIVKQDVRTEVYAKGVGLIYKESVILEYCTQSICLGKQIVDKGLRYKQVVKEYGSH